jgi:diacylglycerol O-acyltransferase
VERLSGIDHMFLGTESDAYPMDGAAIMLLDAAGAGPEFGFDEVRDFLARKIAGTPVLTKRLRQVRWLGPGYATAFWAPDPHFTLDRHLDRATVPPPGDRAALAALTVALSGGRLPRDRPLWKAWYVDGLADGGAALVVRIHHAAVDATAGMQMLGSLLDFEPSPPRTAAPSTALAPSRSRVPTSVELIARAAPELMLHPARSARRAVSLARALSAGRREAQDAERGRLFRDARDGCLFNRPARDAEKSLALLELPMDRVKLVKDELGVTLTDLALGLVTGSLRRYLADRAETVNRPLSAMCPMSVRAADDRSAQGNRFLFLVNRLPIQLADPLERIAAIRRETELSKRVGRAEAEVENTIVASTEIFPSGAWGVIGALPDSVIGRAPAMFNLTLSSVPGPPFPMYLAGAEVTHLHLRTFTQRGGSGLFITCMGYNGTLHIGITALRELVPDPERLAAGIEDELVVLEQLESAGARMVANGSTGPAPRPALEATT